MLERYLVATMTGQSLSEADIREESECMTDGSQAEQARYIF